MSESEPYRTAINKSVSVAFGGTLNLDLAEVGLNNTQNIYVTPQAFNPAPLDESSVLDFADRYVTLDALSASEDGADLAYLRVLEFVNNKFGKHIFPLNQTSEEAIKYKELIVTNCQTSMVEKAQIIKTNNTLQVYAFDSQVEVLNIQGVLKSTATDRWDIAMVLVWDELLRLTKLIQRKFICEFGYESNVYWGYPLNFTYQKSSNTQYLVNFSMQFIVIKRSIFLREGNLFLDQIFDGLQALNNGSAS